MIQAKLDDGTVLEFPDDTPQEVMDKVAKEEWGRKAKTSAPFVGNAPIPEGGSAPISTLTPEGSPPEVYIGGEPPPTPGPALGGVPQLAGGLAAGGLAIGAGTGLAATTGLVALGGAAGEAYKQLGQHLSGSLDAPKTSIDAAKRIGRAGLEEGTWEMVGGLVAKGFGKILKPLQSVVSEEAKAAREFFKGKIKPIVLLPAEATESRVLDLFQNVAEGSIFGGGSIQKFKTKRTEFFNDFADSLIDGFGKQTDPTDLGNLFITSVNNSKAIHRKASQVLYNSVKAGRVKTDLISIKRFAKPLQRKAAKLEGIEAKNAGDDLIGAVLDLPDKLSFKEATELRSRLLSRIDEFSILNKKAPAIGKARKMVGLLDSAIEKSLKGKEALVAWRAANEFYREGQQKFNNTLLRRLTKLADDTGTGAEMIAPAIFKPGHVSSIQKVKVALKNDPKTWKKMQGFFVQHLMDKSKDVNGNIMGKKLLNSISGKPGSFGTPMLQEIFNTEQIKTLNIFGETVKLAQKGQKSGTGKMFIQLTQAGAIVSMPTTGLTTTAATVIIAPAIMAKMLLSPATCRIMTAGVKMGSSTGTERAAGIAARLVAAAWRIEGDVNK